MQIHIVSKGIDVSAALSERINNRLEEMMDKYIHRDGEAHISISKEGPGFNTSISVHLPSGATMAAHGNAKDAYGASDEALVHLEKRLRRYKRRLKDHKGRSTEALIPANQYILQSEHDHHKEEPDQPIIVAELQTEIETLDVGEAVMRMDLANLPALMFRSSKHGGLNMVYKRQDGNIGWVDPHYAAEAKAL